jgi:hypothetical protein
MRSLALTGIILGTLLLLVGVTSFVLSRICADCGKAPEDWNETYATNLRLKLAAVAKDIHAFSDRHGRAPSNLRELYSELPQDPWGNELAYDSRPDGSYSLRSAGPDRKVGTADDVARSVDPKIDAEFDALLTELESRPTPRP